MFNPSATVAGLSEYLWKLEQPAHAVANQYFVGAINRPGFEEPWRIGEFYGQSYFCTPRGQMLAVGKRDDDDIVIADLDLDMIREVRNHGSFSGTAGRKLTDKLPTYKDTVMSAQVTASRARTPLPMTDHRPAPYQGPSREEVFALRQQYLTPGLLTYYQQPVDDRRRAHAIRVGRDRQAISRRFCRHRHRVRRPLPPENRRQGARQVGKLQHTTTIYLHPTIGQFGKKLAEQMPAASGLTDVISRTRAARPTKSPSCLHGNSPANHEIISLRNGYHGGTQAAMGLTAHGNWKFKSNPDHQRQTRHAGYCYRCPYGLEYPSCDVKCASDMEDLIRYETTGDVACFIGEPIQGVGGVVTPPPEYFKIVYDIVRRHGGLCIADEVQTGFGRTGTHFWGFENWGVTPDMVTMAKGIGNGVPLGGCVTRPEIAAMMKNRIHFNTFGGNPDFHDARVGHAGSDRREDIQDNARVVGGHLKNRLLELQERQPLIGEVRGMGLMLGVELVRDRETKEPATTETVRLLELAKNAAC